MSGGAWEREKGPSILRCSLCSANPKTLILFLHIVDLSLLLQTNRAAVYRHPDPLLHTSSDATFIIPYDLKRERKNESSLKPISTPAKSGALPEPCFFT